MISRPANSRQSLSTARRAVSAAVVTLLAMFLAPAHLPAADLDPAGLTLFEQKIRPVLVEHCYQCHSAEAAKAGKLKGNLLLDSRPGTLRGGDSGSVVVPNNPGESLLIAALRHEDLKMPPSKKLPDLVIADFVRWIEIGAPDPRTENAPMTDTFQRNLATARTFWSFQPVRGAVVPAVRNTAWPQSEIDRFVLARLEAAGLEPAPAADRRTLIRRATFDLTGLPPTPDEVEAFCGDGSPDAWARVVDRLLASPHYGERWGRHWLDVVRYADTAGETADFPAPHAWRYRNYVIDALNQDKSYDQFLREQLAGDILANQLPPDAPRARRAELLTATGYIAIARRFGFNVEHDHYLTIEDTIDTLGKSVLGLTIGCARCHDHKYDPISAADYYALYGIFDSSQYAFPGSEHVKRPRDLVPLASPDEVAQLTQAHQQQLAALDAELAKADEALKGAREQAKAQNTPAEQAAEQIKPLEATAAQAKQARDAHTAAGPKYDVAYAVIEAKPHNAQLQKRGDPKDLGEEVPRRFLTIFGGQPVPPDAGSGRWQLAEWLTSPANPLTARVIVNRVWQYHFGAGLVRTPNDFGTRGQEPTHPELLDSLARRLVAEGWSLKKLHRAIMLSSVYQMGAHAATPAVSQTALSTDADNRLLWHFPQRRLSVEEIRDSLLVIGGNLDRAPGGPHPFPAESTWNFTQHDPFVALYPSAKRSVYLMTQRIKLHPLQALFDGPDPNSSTPVRYTTTVPTQALFFLNSEFVDTQAAGLAAQLAREADDAARLNRAYALLFARTPTSDELTAANSFFERYRAALGGNAADQTPAAWAAYARVLLATNEFLYVD